MFEIKKYVISKHGDFTYRYRNVLNLSNGQDFQCDGHNMGSQLISKTCARMVGYKQRKTIAGIPEKYNGYLQVDDS